MKEQGQLIDKVERPISTSKLKSLLTHTTLQRSSPTLLETHEIMHPISCKAKAGKTAHLTAQPIHIRCAPRIKL